MELGLGVGDGRAIGPVLGTTMNVIIMAIGMTEASDSPRP